MVTTFAISGGVLKKAGLNVSSALSAGTILVSASNFIVDHWINNAEATICTNANYDYLTNFTSLASGKREIITETAEALAAMDAISYDMSGYTSLAEAQTMLNFHKFVTDRNMNLLKDKSTTKSFITGE